MAKDFNSVERLDSVLNYLKGKEFSTIFEMVSFLLIELSYLNEILEKLMLDGFVKMAKYYPADKEDEFYTVHYLITFEGRVFIEKGGYLQQLKNANSSNRAEYIRTLILTYGTAAAGGYGIFEILKWAFHHLHWKLPF